MPGNAASASSGHGALTIDVGQIKTQPRFLHRALVSPSAGHPGHHRDTGTTSTTFPTISADGTAPKCLLSTEPSILSPMTKKDSGGTLAQVPSLDTAGMIEPASKGPACGGMHSPGRITARLMARLDEPNGNRNTITSPRWTSTERMATPKSPRTA